MKLNYRDKMILAILIAIAILLAGYFALIKPKTEDIETHKITLSQKETEKAEIEAKIAQIEPLKTEINDTYTETNKLSKIFVTKEEIENPRKLDQFMQDFANECEVKVYSLESGKIGVSPINYYYYQPDDPGASIRAAADINGDLQQEVDDRNAEATALSQRSIESVFKAQYAIRVNGKKENIWNYLKGIEEYSEAVIINSVNIADYSFGADSEETAQPSQPQGEGEEGEVAPTPTQSGEKTDTSDVSLVISLYSVYNMSEPNTELN